MKHTLSILLLLFLCSCSGVQAPNTTQSFSSNSSAEPTPRNQANSIDLSNGNSTGSNKATIAGYSPQLSLLTVKVKDAISQKKLASANVEIENIGPFKYVGDNYIYSRNLPEFVQINVSAPNYKKTSVFIHSASVSSLEVYLHQNKTAPVNTSEDIEEEVEYIYPDTYTGTTAAATHLIDSIEIDFEVINPKTGLVNIKPRFFNSSGKQFFPSAPLKLVIQFRDQTYGQYNSKEIDYLEYQPLSTLIDFPLYKSTLLNVEVSILSRIYSYSQKYIPVKIINSYNLLSDLPVEKLETAHSSPVELPSAKTPQQLGNVKTSQTLDTYSQTNSSNTPKSVAKASETNNPKQQQTPLIHKSDSHRAYTDIPAIVELPSLITESIPTLEQSSKAKTSQTYTSSYSSSSSVVHVSGYYRSDGTYVRGHTRSKPKR